MGEIDKKNKIDRMDEMNQNQNQNNIFRNDTITCVV